MKILKAYLFLLSLMVLSSCGDKVETLEEQNLTLEQKVEKSINMEYLKDLNVSENQVAWLTETYSKNEYKSFWINDSSLTDEGFELKRLVDNPYLFATPINRYAFIRSHDSLSVYQQEQLITLKLAYLTNDLYNGFIDTLNHKLKDISLPNSESFSALLKNNDNKDWENKLLNLSSPHPKYNATLKGINNFVKSYPLDTMSFKIESMKEDSIATYRDARQALFSKGFIDYPEVADTILIEKIKEFQRLNALTDDGIIGTFTAKALNESNLSRYNRGILALDKWRWKDSLPNKYIWVNIPAYELNFYVNDSLKRVHKVVVGANATTTPEFTAKMKTIVSYPFWHVPYSISSTEILSGAKKDTNYFAKRGYKIFRDNQEVNPTTVDWSVVNQTNFRYRVRQDGGGSNALGLVKMLFPNKHSVYIHDTPSKRFFANDVRAYSHGCIRCQDPRDLAKYILERDNNTYTPDSLDALIARKQMQHIALRKPFDVFIDYITVGTNKNDDLQFYIDIYKRDDQWLEILDPKVILNEDEEKILEAKVEL